MMMMMMKCCWRCGDVAVIFITDGDLEGVNEALDDFVEFIVTIGLGSNACLVAAEL